MRPPFRFFVLAMLGMLGACAAPGPPFDSVSGTLPPVPASEARIFFYRDLEPYEALAPTTAYLNGQAVAVTRNGTVLYRDVAPGQYLVSVFSRGEFPSQFKTVALRAGETAYVKVESLANWAACGGAGGGKDGGGGANGCDDTFTVDLVNPVAAQYEMRDLIFLRG